MSAIRAPFSALGGVAFSVALFLGLANLVNVPFEIAPTNVAQPIALKPVRPDTPVTHTRNPRVVPEPPTLAPGLPKIGIVDGGDAIVQRAIYTRPKVDTRPARHGLMRGLDGDVTAIIKTKPEYPPRELARGTQGWVRVQFSVTSIGTVRDAVVVDSEPEAVFDQAALKAIARWRYNPRVENGEAVERVGLQTIIRFTLQD